MRATLSRAKEARDEALAKVEELRTTLVERQGEQSTIEAPLQERISELTIELAQRETEHIAEMDQLWSEMAVAEAQFRHWAGLFDTQMSGSRHTLIEEKDYVSNQSFRPAS